jgi:hypothetical protein
MLTGSQTASGCGDIEAFNRCLGIDRSGGSEGLLSSLQHEPLSQSAQCLVDAVDFGGMPDVGQPVDFLRGCSPREFGWTYLLPKHHSEVEPSPSGGPASQRPAAWAWVGKGPERDAALRNRCGDNSVGGKQSNSIFVPLNGSFRYCDRVLITGWLLEKRNKVTFLDIEIEA